MVEAGASNSASSERRPPEVILGGEVSAVIGQVLHDVVGALADRGVERAGTALGPVIHVQSQLHHQLHGIQFLASGGQENPPCAVRQFDLGSAPSAISS